MKKLIPIKDRLFLAAMVLTTTLLFRFRPDTVSDYILLGSLILIYMVYLIHFFVFTLQLKPTPPLYHTIAGSIVTVSVILYFGVQLF